MAFVLRDIRGDVEASLKDRERQNMYVQSLAGLFVESFSDRGPLNMPSLTNYTIKLNSFIGQINAATVSDFRNTLTDLALYLLRLYSSRTDSHDSRPPTVEQVDRMKKIWAQILGKLHLMCVYQGTSEEFVERMTNQIQFGTTPLDLVEYMYGIARDYMQQMYENLALVEFAHCFAGSEFYQAALPMRNLTEEQLENVHWHLRDRWEKTIRWSVFTVDGNRMFFLSSEYHGDQ